MAKYMIPDTYKNGFRMFLSMDQETLDKLILEIENSSEGILPQKLPEKLHKVLGIDLDNLKELVAMLFSLYRAKDDSGVDIQEFSDGIFNALEQDIELKGAVTKNTQQSLHKVLSISGPFLLTLKALEFARERERLTIETRIITDIRPIISKDNSLLGSIMIHDLVIAYQEGEHMQETHFALDRNDLKQLKEAIEKAEITENLIREKFKSTENIFIEVD